MKPKTGGSNLLSKLSMLADTIREERQIGFGKLAIKTGESISSLEKLRPALLQLFTDIHYENHTFYTRMLNDEQVDRVLTAQPEPSVAKAVRKR